MLDIFSYSFFDLPFLKIGLLLIIVIMFLYGQYLAIEAVSEQSRKLAPNDVWFQLIPLFNLYWAFVVVNRLSASFAAEFDRLHIKWNELYPTRALGIAAMILNLVSMIPFGELQIVAGLVWLACFMLYWVQVYKCRKLILANQGLEMLDVEREMLNKTS
jgi:hypothetical protein